MEQADFSSAGPNGLLEVVAILWRLRLEAEARRPAPALRLIRVEELMAEWTVDPALEMVRDNPEAGAARLALRQVMQDAAELFPDTAAVEAFMWGAADRSGAGAIVDALSWALDGARLGDGSVWYA
jgi:hypothetical protein